MKHCLQCNKCIEGYVCHSSVLSNCVGEANYRWFVASLVCWLPLLLAIVTFTSYLMYEFKEDQHQGKVLAALKWSES